MGSVLDDFLIKLATPVAASDTRGSSNKDTGEVTNSQAATTAVTTDAAADSTEQSEEPAEQQPPQGLGVATAQAHESEDSNDQRCFWFPFCPMKANKCGGLKKSSTCSYLVANPSKKPPLEVLKEKKDAIRREEKRVRAALRRDAKKKQKEEQKAVEHSGSAEI